MIVSKNTLSFRITVTPLELDGTSVGGYRERVTGDSRLAISGERILLRFKAPAATKFSTPRDLQIASVTMQILATASSGGGPGSPILASCNGGKRRRRERRFFLAGPPGSVLIVRWSLSREGRTLGTVVRVEGFFHLCAGKAADKYPTARFASP